MGKWIHVEVCKEHNIWKMEEFGELQILTKRSPDITLHTELQKSASDMYSGHVTTLIGQTSIQLYSVLRRKWIMYELNVSKTPRKTPSVVKRLFSSSL